MTPRPPPVRVSGLGAVIFLLLVIALNTCDIAYEKARAATARSLPRVRLFAALFGTVLALQGCVTSALDERVALLEEKVARLEADVALLQASPPPGEPP